MAKEKGKNTRLGCAGGQALIEGIMMNAPGGAAIAVRRPDGSIIVKRKKMSRLKDKFKVLGLPFVRGVVSFAESMILGYKSLMESADLSGMLDMEEDEKKKGKEEKPGKFKALMGVISVVAMVLGVALSLLLFLALPAYLFDLLNTHLANGSLVEYKALFEGTLKMLVFVLYLLAVSRMKDIRRTFMYHGAEHKTIFCYEAYEDLTVENIRKYKRFHPRCGTSFLFFVLLISILLSSLILTIFESLKDPSNRVLWIAIKVLLMPVIMGIGYECIRLSGKYDNWFTRAMAFPGMLMQRLTTVEPTDDMIEVAIAALEGALDTQNFGERILNEQKDDAPQSILRAELVPGDAEASGAEDEAL